METTPTLQEQRDNARPRIIRPLLRQTPVLAVHASERGIQVVGEDRQYNRFEGWDRHYDQTLQAKRQKQREARWGYQEPRMNPIQQSMYNRLLHGLKEYTPAQLAAMDAREIERVKLDFKRAQDVIHRLKCDIYFDGANKLLNSIWPSMQIGSKTQDYLTAYLPGELTLRRLRISTERVVERLINWKLLPTDFMTLSAETLELH